VQARRKFRQVPRLAFPNHQNAPAIFAKQTANSSIALHVFQALVLPEFGVCRRDDVAIPATVHVPEAAMNKNYRLEPTQNYVGFAGESVEVEPVAKAHRMQ
jgi:hypothetical protein